MRKSFGLPTLASVLLIVGLLALSVTPIRATLTGTSAITAFSGSGVVWDPDVAYDPITQRFLVAYTYLDKGPWGLYLHPNGQPDGSPFLIVNGYGQYARVNARPTGAGGFLVTYFIGGAHQAVFVRPGAATVGPLAIGSGSPLEWDGAGAVYVPDYDQFLVTYQGGRHTYIVNVGSSTGYSQDLTLGNAIGVTQSTGECSGEWFGRSEIAWDPATDRAMVVGWRDFTECSAMGGLWYRTIAFNGSAVSTPGAFSWMLKGGVLWDVNVAWSDAAQRFVALWSRDIAGGRALMKTTLDTNGTMGTIRTILAPNTTTGSLRDDYFGRDNQVELEYHPTTGRFLLGVRGNDNNATPYAPAFFLELDSNGDAIPYTLSEPFPVEPPRPFPRVVAIPGTSNFLAMIKAGIPANVRGELDLMTAVITGDGTQGSGAWPTTSGTDYNAGGGSGGGGGGGGGGSSTYTLTITKPTGGTILGPDIWCGDAGNTCQTTKPAGQIITLTPLGTGGNGLSSWGGCSASFALTSNLTCAPTFSGGSGGGGGGGSASYTLTITKPSGGTILGPDIWCGDGGNSCQITRAAGTVISLTPIPSGSNTLSTWGGCSASFALNANTTCAPVFTGAGGGVAAVAAAPVTR
jgi:hypothetical protein